MRNRKQDKEIPQAIPEGCNWESQSYKSKAAEMPDKGIRAWNKTKTIPEGGNRESRHYKIKEAETPDKGPREWLGAGIRGWLAEGIREWIMADMRRWLNNIRSMLSRVAARRVSGSQLLFSKQRDSVHLRSTGVRGVQVRGQQNAFTLMELLVVVLIMGVLVAIAIPQYQIAVEKAHATEAITWARHLAEAEEMYYMANGTYTRSLEQLGVTIPDSPYYRHDRILDSSLWNVYILSNRGYMIRYFMKNLPSSASYAGRVLCIASEESKKGTAVCRALSGVQGTRYPLDRTSNYKQYPLN